MDLKQGELYAEWKKGRFRPVYYLLGEPSARSQAVKDIKKLLNPGDFDLSEFSTLADPDARAVVGDALTAPLLSERRLVIVNTKLPAAAKKVLAAYLKNPVKSTTLVLISDDRRADPKDPLVPAVRAAGALCVFYPLRDDEAQRRLISTARQAGKILSEEAALAIVEESGTDWAILRQELRHIISFAGKNAEVTLEMTLQCLGFSKAVDPFALSRLIQNRDLAGSLGHLRKALAAGKPGAETFRALNQISSALFKQFRAKSLLKTDRSHDQILATLRVNKYWDKDFLPRVGRISEVRLMRDLERCLTTEADLKSKAWLDPKIELENLVADVCGAKRS